MEYDFNSERVIRLAYYILEHRTTIRATAKQFDMPKSSVHRDLSVKLKHLDYPLYCEVQKLMDENFSIKHIHGGESTKYKYAQLRNAINKFEETEATLGN